MTTTAQAAAAIRARIETNYAGAALLRWQDENVELPDAPAAILYVEIVAERERLHEIGGGRGANGWRNDGRVEIYAMTPRGQGIAAPLALAETAATILRGQAFDGVSCLAAAIVTDRDVSINDGNYAVACAVVDYWFTRTA